ncbi:MAG: hypothetical protein HY000_10875, partial [Planctomycetes bacterium]|nr:hypothetical protein [Planctomycetota bacterium]
MRLTGADTRRAELIALAMFYGNCRQSNDDDVWLPLDTAFFVPLDDVPDLAPPTDQPDDEAEPDAAVRADLLHVGLPGRGGLSLTFIEVKYRRHLRSARETGLLEHVSEQVATTRRRWMEWYFGEDMPEVVLAVRRSRLVRALRFYLDKSVRHSLAAERRTAFVCELDKLVTQGGNYRLSRQQREADAAGG